MIRSSIARWVIGVIAAIAVLGLIRFKPWERNRSAALRQDLKVGFLPVT